MSPAFEARVRPGAVSTDNADAALRELMVVRAIVHAFLTAEKPEDVFRVALEHVSPLVGATFASVYLTEGTGDLMRLAVAHNWPERFRPFLGDMRVKVGSGPSGRAAGERRSVMIPDVFADPQLHDWQEVATELGFRALVALPLATGTRVLGAVTFYFADAGAVEAERRDLLRLVADQMAATAEKARLIEDLRRANTALVESNAELERQHVAVLEARRLKDEFLANMSHELRTPLTAVMGYIALMLEELSGPLTDDQRNDLQQVKISSDRLLSMIEDLLQLTSLKGGVSELEISDFDPRAPMREAVASHRATSTVAFTIDEPRVMLPSMRSDRRKIVKILASLLSNAFKFTASGEVRVGIEVRSGKVRYRVADTGIGIPAVARQVIFDEFRQVDGSVTREYGGSGLGLTLARRLARLLGGDIEVESVPGQGSTFSVALPLELR